MEKSLRRWPYRIPFVAALVAVVVAGLAGSALAFSPAPDPAPTSGVTVSPRPDAARGTSAARTRAQSPRRSSTASTPPRTARSTAAGGAQDGRTSTPTQPAVTVTTPVVHSEPLPNVAGSRLAASTRHSGRDGNLLLSAVIALGALTLGSLGLLGLSRRLRQEVPVR